MLMRKEETKDLVRVSGETGSGCWGKY